VSDPFAATISWAWDGPPPGTAAADRARLLLLDSLGCMAAGLRHARLHALAAALAAWLPGEVRLAGAGLAPAGAAALLATAMCWDEANEGLARAHGRPGLAVVPLCVARPAATLGDTLAALALGYEVAGRAGELWRIQPGMHVDGSWHALGAAAAAVRLAGGDRAAAARAVRLTACQVPFALYAPIAAGMDGRNSYPAHAALLGALAGATAMAGLDAPAEGFAEARRLALGLERPGACAPPGAWLVAEAYLKPFAGVRHAHYAAAAALALRSRLLDRLDRIAAIGLATYAEALRYAGNRAPRAAITAQFSLSWAVAAALAQGDLGPEAYTEAALRDPRLRRLEALVTLREDPTRGERRGATLSVTVDGATLAETVDTVPGDPAQPMGEAEVLAKLRRHAGEAAVARGAALLGAAADAPGTVLRAFLAEAS
jgi:2-methylcitrate dehydratase PrpD